MSDSEESTISTVKQASANETPSTDATEEERQEEKHSDIVASHYNNIQEQGLATRKRSNIFFMRNFNNWVKSVMIDKYSNLVKNRTPIGSPFRVLDMCCGKGGDLLKWSHANVTHLICTDIAQISLEQCETRFNSMFPQNRDVSRRPKAEFIAADATLTQLRSKYNDPSMKLHLVSCQFAFHYSFESFKQANCMLKNAAECLVEGFYFIGTMPDAYEIMKRQRVAMSDSFGNEVYNIQLLCDTDNPPLFGAKYNFHLDGVVDCPEFLVHFPTFEKLALRHGLRLVEKRRFQDVCEEFRFNKQGLMEKMQALETYPPDQSRWNADGSRKNSEQYSHVEEYRKKIGGGDHHFRVGTLSQMEWEAATIYLCFAFQKLKTSYDANGRPVYS